MSYLLDISEVAELWSANLWHQRHVRGTVAQWAARNAHRIDPALSDLSLPLTLTPEGRVLLDGHHRYATALALGHELLAVTSDPDDPDFSPEWRWLWQA